MNQFLNFKVLNSQPGYAKAQQYILDQIGLTDEIELLCDLEAIVRKYQEYKSKLKTNDNKKGLKTYGSRR